MPASTPDKMRLWVLPWGLYPRRVTIYLKEKGIISNFEIIDVNITLSGMEQVPDKPPGSMPILEIRRPSSPGARDGEYIYQSTAILEYLEDIYGPESGTPNMRGTTPMEVARTRDLISILNDTNEALSMYFHNASALFSTLEKQSISAAEWGKDRLHNHLKLLDNLTKNNDGPWLTGSERPSIADCMAMATVQFAWFVYGVDLCEGHESLKRVWEGMEGRESVGMEEVPGFVGELAPKMSVR